MDRTRLGLSWLSMIGMAMTGCMGDVATESDLEGADKSVINGTQGGDAAVVAVHMNGSLCTGTLVAPDRVLTAAHCVAGRVNSVGFGLYGNENVVPVVSQHAHPRWTGNNLNAGVDIAVLKLSRAVPSSVATPIPVSVDPGEVGPGTDRTPRIDVEITGYGNNNGRTGTGAGIKRTADVIVSAAQQEDAFVVVSDGDGTQTCNGDSGGPVFFAPGGVKRVVGVTSFGYQGCVGGSYHTRVANHTAFLESHQIPVDGAGGGDGSGDGSGDDGGGDDGSGDDGSGGDTTPPSISLASPSNGQTISRGQQRIVFNVSDDVALSDVVMQWHYNNTSVSCAQPPSGWTCAYDGRSVTFRANIGRGTRRFTTTAIDTSGNETSTPEHVIYLR